MYLEFLNYNMEYIYRNPNEPQEAEPVHGIRQEKNRFKNIEWVPYEVIHKKYLSLGICY